MNQVIAELLNHSYSQLKECNANALVELEKILDDDESKSEVLTKVEIAYFKLGLKAGINLIKSCNNI